MGFGGLIGLIGFSGSLDLISGSEALGFRVFRVQAP